MDSTPTATDSTGLSGLAAPGPGTPIVRVIEHYTETARRFEPRFDLELVPLVGKNPQIGGLSWFSHASSDPSVVLAHLRALGAGLRRVDGLGALMDRHVCFDVDHPEFLPPRLSALLGGGLVSATRPGRRHYIFRVPSGRRYGGRKDLINRIFPCDGSWGEIKGFHSQVRIWSPNSDGTHVGLVVGPIPDLPASLAAVLMEPEFLTGDPVTDAILDDWLDSHVGGAHPEWLAADVARVGESDPADLDNSKNRRCLRRIWHVGINVAAGMYGGRAAYEALYGAYFELCVAEGDWVEGNDRKYRDIWRRAVGKLTTDPRAEAAIEEKRRASWGVEWDPEHSAADRELEEFIRDWAIREGAVPAAGAGAAGAGGLGSSADLTRDEITAMLSAVDVDGDGAVGDVVGAVGAGDGGAVAGGGAVGAVDQLRERLATRAREHPGNGAGAGAGVGPTGVGAGPTPVPVTPGEKDEEIRASSPPDPDLRLEPAVSPGPGPGPGPGPEPEPEGPPGPGGSGAPAGAPTTPEEALAAYLALSYSPEIPGASPYDRFVAGRMASSDESAMSEFKKLVSKEAARRMMSDMRRKPLVKVSIDVSKIVAETPPPYMALQGRSDGLGLIYVDAVSSLYGDKACGKSWLLAAEALVRLRAGQQVAWLDWEMSANRLGTRLLQLGATPEEVAALWYFAMSASTVEDARRELSGLGPGSLVVIDSVVRALVNEGVDVGDEDSNTAYVAWFERVAGLRAATGLCVVTIDHVGHTMRHRARGASAKGQAADSELSMLVVEPWSRSRAGWASLVVRKDRGGFLVTDEPAYGAFFTPVGARELVGGAGRIDGGLSVVVRELGFSEKLLASAVMASEAERARLAKEALRSDERAKLEGRVLDVLGDGERHSRRELAAEVGESEKTLRPVLDALVADGSVVDHGLGRYGGLQRVAADDSDADA